MSILLAPLCLFAAKPDADRSVCYLLAAEYQARAGGQPAPIHIRYANRSGLVQETDEMTDDYLIQLKEGKFSIAAELGGVDVSALPPLPTGYEKTAPGAIRIPEASGPTVVVEAGLCDGTKRRWVGAIQRVTPAAKHSEAILEAFARRVAEVRLAPGGRYIRAQALPAYEAQYTNPGVQITPADLQRTPELSLSIASQRQLVALHQGDPFAPIGLAFEHGKTIYARFHTQVFEIRQIIVPNTQKGDSR